MMNKDERFKLPKGNCNTEDPGEHLCLGCIIADMMNKDERFKLPKGN